MPALTPRVLLAFVVAAGTAHAADACGPFPRLAAPTQPGWCAATVADGQRHGLRMPRSVLWLGRSGEDDTLLVADMGSWEPRRGRLLQLAVNSRTGHVRVQELLRQLDRPHGLRKGPDGRIWLAEATRISRFTLPGPQPQTVVDGLPAEGRHPLKAFVFGPDGSLYINAGAASDNCDPGAAVGRDGLPTCPEMAGGRPQAAVYRARVDFATGRLLELRPFATGLRNSTALAAHASGSIWQGENNIDTGSSAHFPAEEINRLEAGGHYGWPGCVEMRKPLPGFDARACARTRAPVLLMPAHAAPLHMDFAQGGLLVSWHGYRAGGQRIVRYAVAPDGTPRGQPTVLLGPWTLGPNRFGAPVGWAEDAGGALWIADDRNRMLLRLARD